MAVKDGDDGCCPFDREELIKNRIVALLEPTPGLLGPEDEIGRRQTDHVAFKPGLTECGCGDEDLGHQHSHSDQGYVGDSLRSPQAVAARQDVPATLLSLNWILGNTRKSLVYR